MIECVCLCGCGGSWTKFDRRSGSMYADGEACRARVNRDPQLRAAVRAAAESRGQNHATPHPTPVAASSTATGRAKRVPKRRTEHGTRIYLLPDELLALGIKLPKVGTEAGKRASAKLRAARARLF